MDIEEDNSLFFQGRWGPDPPRDFCVCMGNVGSLQIIEYGFGLLYMKRVMRKLLLF